MAIINYKMESEEDIFKFVQYVTTNHSDLLYGYQDYQIILAGNIYIENVPSYYIVFNDDNLVLLTLTDDGNSVSHYIDRTLIELAFKNYDEITFKYNKERLFIIRGNSSDITALFEFINVSEEQKKFIESETEDVQSKIKKKQNKEKKKPVFLYFFGAMFVLAMICFGVGLVIF